MSSAVYAKYKHARNTGALTFDLSGATIKAALIDTASYTFSHAHQYYSDLAGVVGTPVALANKACTLSGANDLFSCDPIAFTGLVSAPTIEAIVLYRDTGNPATSELIAYIDTAAGLPTVALANAVTVSQHPIDKLIKF